MNVRLRDLQLPEDFSKLVNLFNAIEPGSATIESLEEENGQFPPVSKLSLDEQGLLAGFGRMRVIAENADGQVIGYGASWRAPWSDPGELASSFCVHPDYRKQGVGETILNHIEDWAQTHQASMLLSAVEDWIPDTLPFVEKRGFSVDAHLFELRLDLQDLDLDKWSEPVGKLKDSGIHFLTLADIPGEESEQKLYQLFVETSKDNPGQHGSLPEFQQWRREALPEDCSKEEWVFIAVDGERFVGVTTLFSTDEPGVMYTDYTGVSRDYRGRGLAKALKLLSIRVAMNEGTHTMTTDTEAGNSPMQTVNKSLGYVPGKGHYRIRKQFK